jgi:CheY-like chemotaxis protein
MKTDDEELNKLRSWLIEDTGSEAEADRLLPVVDRLGRLSDLVADLSARAELSRLLLKEQRGRRAQRTLVWIEDDAAMLNLGSVLLKSRDYQVLGAMSGREGLELVSRVHPDLVLLDLMIPDMDGWEICQRMKADKQMSSVPVIVVSAKAEASAKEFGLEIVKIQDYITKPFSPSELMNSVDRVLAGGGENAR